MKCDGVDVMSVRPGEGEVGEDCSQHPGATPNTLPQVSAAASLLLSLQRELPNGTSTAPADWLPLPGKLSLEPYLLNVAHSGLGFITVSY